MGWNRRDEETGRCAVGTRRQKMKKSTSEVSKREAGFKYLGKPLLLSSNSNAHLVQREVFLSFQISPFSDLTVTD